MRKDELILAREGVELVGGSDEILAGQLGDCLGDLDVKALRRVQTRADRRAAQRQLFQRRERELEHFAVLFQTAAPAGDLLRELDGRGVLQMRAPGFYDAAVFFFQTQQRRHQLVDRREELILDGGDGSDVHRRGEGVVRRLGHIDVVVRVQELFARELIAAVGDDLVGVHV